MQIVFLNGPFSFNEALDETLRRGLQPIVILEEKYRNRWINNVQVTAYYVEKLSEDAISQVLQQNCFNRVKYFYAFADQDVSLAQRMNNLNNLNSLADNSKVDLLHNKLYLREQLQLSVNMASFETLTLDDLASFLPRLGVSESKVLKPAIGYSSLGVTRIDSTFHVKNYQTEMKEVFQRLESESVSLNEENRQALSDRMLIAEDFIPGREAAVDAVVINGEVRYLQVCSKMKMRPPWYEEIAYIAPGDFSELQFENLKTAAGTVISELKINTSILHLEFILGDENRPYFIDVGFRLGGRGLSSRLSMISTGTCMFGLLLDGLLENPSPLGKENKTAILYLQQVGAGGRVEKVLDKCDIDPKELKPSELVEMVSFVAEGDPVTGYPNHSGLPGYLLFSLPKNVEMSEVYSLLSYCEKNLNPRYEVNGHV